MFPYADPMRLMQTWCDAATAMTRANMATCEALNTHMSSLLMGTTPQAQTQARPATWLDQWSVLTTPRFSPFMPFAPPSFAPALPAPTSAMTNPWMAGWGMPGPFGAMFASMTEAMMRPVVGFGDPQPAHHAEPSREQRQSFPFDVAYRGAGGHAVAPSIKFSAEVPVSTLAAMATAWTWPWAAGKFA